MYSTESYSINSHSSTLPPLPGVRVREGTTPKEREPRGKYFLPLTFFEAREFLESSPYLSITDSIAREQILDGFDSDFMHLAAKDELPILERASLVNRIRSIIKSQERKLLS